MYILAISHLISSLGSAFDFSISKSHNQNSLFSPGISEKE
jgi:hypothetical protein